MSGSAAISAPFIAVEESYLSPHIQMGTSTLPTDAALHLIPSPILSKLKNLGPSRVREMRFNGVSMQIVSHIPIDATPPTCQRINDALYSQIVTNADRFAALALLPSSDPKEAARELQRCVTKYRFVGGVLGFRRGERGEGIRVERDGMAYEELWAMAERYRVPIALRPLFPTREQISEYKGAYPDTLLGPLVTNFYPSHSTSPLLILRLYLSGVFDQHPNLRLVVSQTGHSIPGLIPRIEALKAPLSSWNKPMRTFLDVWQHNFYVTTADVLDLAGMRALLDQIPMDRVLFAGNYPWEERGRGLMGELRESGAVSREEWERIAWGNAEWLFGLKVKGGK